MGEGKDPPSLPKGKDYLDGGGGADTAKRVGPGDRVVSCTVKR